MNRSTSQNPPEADPVAVVRYVHSTNHQSASGLASQPALPELVGVSRYPGTINSRTNRAQLRENVGALNPEFAFAGAAGTTRGPVAQNATTKVFGRQRIGALSLASEKFDGQLFPGHHFIEGDAYPRRIPAAAAGSAQLVNENNCFYTVLLFGR